jgi:hypothetical protein
MVKPINAIAALAMFPSLLVSQGPLEFAAEGSGYRSFADAVRRLREKTGWMLSVEEPIWPVRPLRSAATVTDQQGRAEEPPVPDRIRVSIPSLRGPSARPAAITALVDAFNLQNPGVEMRAETLGDMTVILPESIADSSGGRTPARSILSAEVQVPVAKRAPYEHLEALAEAIARQMNVGVDIDTAAMGFFFNWSYAGQYGAPAEWGTPLRTVRLALLDFLSHSYTPTVWQVDCQVGVASSPGRCILSVIPLTVEVKDRTGRLTKQRLSHERGGGPPEIPPPPPNP